MADLVESLKKDSAGFKKKEEAPNDAPPKNETPTDDPPASPKPDPIPPADPPNTPSDKPTANIADLLKEQGIEASLDDIKAALSKKNAPDPKSAEQEEAEIYNWAVANKKLKSVDEAVAAKNTVSKTDEELARELFAQKQRKKNPNVPQEVIDERFNKHYSQGEGFETEEHELGAEKMKEDADAYREKTISPITAIKNEYAAHTKQQQDISTFHQNLQAFEQQVPSTIEVSVNGEKVNFDLDKEFKTDLQKNLAAAYASFVQIGQGQMFDVKRYVESQIWLDDKQRGKLFGIILNPKLAAERADALKWAKNPIEKPVDIELSEGKKPIDEKQAQDTLQKNLLGQ